MVYIEYTLDFPADASAESREIAVAELGDLGFESFSEEGGLMSAYIPKGGHESARRLIEEYLAGEGISFSVREIADDTNWNAVWESGFSPVDVEGRCYLRAPFHEPARGAEYEIVIMPKMSFGTGHHATTRLMLSAILDGDYAGRTGLDMGSGTGVLAILAAMKGARRVDAVDIDNWACENCVENVAANGVAHIVTVSMGDASLTEGSPAKYDFIFANINRNILLADMDRYALSLKPGGEILFSGFLGVDVPVIEEKAVSVGLKPVEIRSKEGWQLVKCEKAE